jgi:hypothetical protein
MTHRDEDEEIIDSALDTLAWQRREIDRLKGEVGRYKLALRKIQIPRVGGGDWAAQIATEALGEKQ